MNATLTALPGWQALFARPLRARFALRNQACDWPTYKRHPLSLPDSAARWRAGTRTKKPPFACRVLSRRTSWNQGPASPGQESRGPVFVHRLVLGRLTAFWRWRLHSSRSSSTRQPAALRLRASAIIRSWASRRGEPSRSICRFHVSDLRAMKSLTMTSC